MHRHDILLSLAVDLTASLASRDRLQRLLSRLVETIACDAAAVLALEDEELVPLATHGLVPEVLGRRFRRAEHPRLDVVLSRGRPIRFPSDSPLPDPYDGLLLATPDATGDVHACLGCPLVADGRAVGVLTLDALEPGAFDVLDEGFLELLGALAGAALRAGRWIDALEEASSHHQRVARELQRDAAGRHGGEQLLGTSSAMHRVRDEIELVAATDFAVLITGETGVGKELVARAIHFGSSRRDQPLIHVNCAALPLAIVESELFGHIRGAFTGASMDRAGKFEIAHRGTLFLDEVGELPLSIQPKLLRALQQGEIQRIGEDRLATVDVRVVAATNRDLPKEVAAGRFRADLLHRLNMYPIHVPPLSSRRSDIPLLAGFFLDRYRRRLGLGPVRLTEAARDALQQGSFQGNVRELDHMLGRAVLRAARGVTAHAVTRIEPSHLDLSASEARDEPQARTGATAPPRSTPRTLREIVEDTKRRAIVEALDEHDGSWAAAARSLGMARGNLHNMATRLGIRGQEETFRHRVSKK